jgi:outer membrane protein TolC
MSPQQTQAAEDEYQVSLATYQQIVISALGQVADQLHGLQHDAETYQANDRALESARSGNRAGAVGVAHLLEAGRLA